MATKGLTSVAVRNAKAGKARKEIPDDGCRGLYLVVQPSGAKSWALRYRFGGRPAKLTLGTLLVIDRDGKEPDKPDIGGPLTLAAARKLAGDALLQVRQGRDPGAQKKAQRVATALVAADTLRLICEEYLKREGPRLRTVGQRRAIFDRLIYPVLGQRQIDSIKRSDVARLLDEVEDKSGARMADMTLAVLRRVMNWHASRSDDFRSPIVRGMARTKPKERARERTLTDDELRAIWKVAADLEGPFGALLRLLLLTGARRSEAASLRWSELAGTDWILPAARNKTKVDLLRPLSNGVARSLTVLLAWFQFLLLSISQPFASQSVISRADENLCPARKWSCSGPSIRNLAAKLSAFARSSGNNITPSVELQTSP
jgi:integrase